MTILQLRNKLEELMHPDKGGVPTNTPVYNAICEAFYEEEIETVEYGNLGVYEPTIKAVMLS